MRTIAKEVLSHERQNPVLARNGSVENSRVKKMLNNPYFQRVFGENLHNDWAQKLLNVFERETHYMLQYLDKVEKFLSQPISICLRRDDNLKKKLQHQWRKEAKEALAAQGMAYRIQEPEEKERAKRLHWLLFQQEVEAVETAQGKTVSILARDEEDKWLYLDMELEAGQEVVEVRIRLNTYPLKKQREVLEWLRERPLPEHLPIIELFNRPEAYYWKKKQIRECSSRIIREPEWAVLKDESKEGTRKQREFVRRVLKNAPFSLLEGPPGTGKTTTILEIIYQLVQRGEKVLMVSSTHAAIDNVLERLKREENLRQEVVALRIGRDESQVKESVREFLLDRQAAEYRRKLKKFFEEQGQLTPAQELMRQALQDEDQSQEWIASLVLDSANLIVGTTIGVLQHPELKRGEKRILFDAVIVDEASKTTFLEFLVPALYAKRWILVGDVKQLSPYVEDKYIAEFLEHADKVPKSEIESIARCFHALQHLRACTPIILTSREQMQADAARLRELGHLSEEEVLVIEEAQIKQSERLEELVLRIQMAAAIVAEDTPVVLHWLYQHMRAKARYFFSRPIQEEEKHPLFQFQERVQRFWYSRKSPTEPAPMAEVVESWGELLAQRLNQRFSFRRAPSDLRGRIEKDIELLTKSLPEVAKQHIRSVERLAFPSVLEMLQEGIPDREAGLAPTVLSQGLCREYKEAFFTQLEYQYRMHGEIAQIPSEEFYKGESLLTPPSVNERPCPWRCHEPRIEWVSVPSTSSKGLIQNPKEAEEIVSILTEIRETLKHGPETEVAVLSFYQDQVELLRQKLRKLTQSNNTSLFEWGKLKIYLYTVDKFQGQEADIVLLSFVKFSPYAHYHSPNRLNVALTRARHKLVLFGPKNRLASEAKLSALRRLASLDERHEILFTQTSQTQTL